MKPEFEVKREEKCQLEENWGPKMHYFSFISVNE